jgi:hypothetical protein
MNDHGYVSLVVVIGEPSILCVMNDHGYFAFVVVIVEPSIMCGNE